MVWMEFQAEIKSAKVGVKKDGDYEYPITVVNLQQIGHNSAMGNLVGKQVKVKAHETTFWSVVKDAKTHTKKIDQIDQKVTTTNLHLDNFNREVGSLVGKQVTVVITND